MVYCYAELLQCERRNLDYFQQGGALSEYSVTLRLNFEAVD